MTTNGVPFGAIMRPGTEADWNFVIARWVSCMFRKPFIAQGGEARAQFQRKLIETIVQDRRADILVAANPQNPESILGYCVHAKFDGSPVVHWIFVKGKEGEFRKRGLAKSMLNHITEGKLGEVPIRQTWHNYFTVPPRGAAWKLIYDPYLIIL
jgi:hypothetical protein